MYVKRDDLTGAQLSGNKVRKLEFLLADALARDADCVVTIGAVQSNHARAAVAARYQASTRTSFSARRSPSSTRATRAWTVTS